MFENVYAQKRVLVTGNTGFKGAWLTVWLKKLGAEVYGLSNQVPTQPSMFEELQLNDHITYYEEDVRNLEAVKNIIAEIKADFIFHLAAQPIVSESYKNPVDTFTTNVIGSCNIMEATRVLNHPCTLVMITSDKAYENVEWTWGYRENDRVGGKDPYSASKGAAEIAIHAFYHSFFKKEESNVRLVSVRAGNVIGGGDWADSRIVPDCVRAWSKGEVVTIRSPRATRPWQHVLEPLSGYLRVGQVLYQRPEFHGESYNFGPAADQSYSVLELLEEIAKHWNFGDQEEIFNVTQNIHFHEAGLLKLNCDKALHELQWKPSLRFEQTSAFTAEWYDKYYHEGADIMLAFTEQQIEQYAQIANEKNIPWAKSLTSLKA